MARRPLWLKSSDGDGAYVGHGVAFRSSFCQCVWGFVCVRERGRQRKAERKKKRERPGDSVTFFLSPPSSILASSTLREEKPQMIK